MGRADRAVHVENDQLRWVVVMKPDRSRCQKKVSERGEVAIQRIAGSHPSRSVSFTSS